MTTTRFSPASWGTQFSDGVRVGPSFGTGPYTPAPVAGGLPTNQEAAVGVPGLLLASIYSYNVTVCAGGGR